MPRLGPDAFREIVSRRGAEEIPAEGVEGEKVEGEEKITDEGEWKAKVNEILTRARGEIEAITPPEFVDRIDDEMRVALAGGTPEVEGGEVTERGL